VLRDPARQGAGAVDGPRHHGPAVGGPQVGGERPGIGCRGEQAGLDGVGHERGDPVAQRPAVRDGMRPQLRVGQVHLQEREIIGHAVAGADSTRQGDQDGHESAHRIGLTSPGRGERVSDGNDLPGGERG
jgi:hypothetical protein